MVLYSSFLKILVNAEKELPAAIKLNVASWSERGAI